MPLGTALKTSLEKGQRIFGGLHSFVRNLFVDVLSDAFAATQAHEDREAGVFPLITDAGAEVILVTFRQEPRVVDEENEERRGDF